MKADDPNFNDSVMYAKCIKGHVLKNADDWILCENLPAPDAQCWQEGGDTIFSLQVRKRKEAQAQAEASQSDMTGEQGSDEEVTSQRATS